MRTEGKENGTWPGATPYYTMDSICCRLLLACFLAPFQDFHFYPCPAVFAEPQGCRRALGYDDDHALVSVLRCRPAVDDAQLLIPSVTQVGDFDAVPKA